MGDHTASGAFVGGGFGMRMVGFGPLALGGLVV